MNPYNQYQNNQIATASQEQILLMLYDGAIKFGKLACKAIDTNDMAAKGKYIGKTMAIVSEFANSLNFEIGGEIAENLDALYSYMLKELSQANVKNEKAPIEMVLTLLEDLRETWAEAIEIKNDEENRKRRSERAREQQFANSTI